MPSWAQPQAIQNALLHVLPTDPKDALPMQRVLKRLEAFLGEDVQENSARKAARGLAKAGAVGILPGSPGEWRYRYWRRA